MALCLVCGNPQSNPECRCEEYAIEAVAGPLRKQLAVADELVRALEETCTTTVNPGRVKALIYSVQIHDALKKYKKLRK